MNQAERRRFLIEELIKERGEALSIPSDEQSQRELLRALMNVRGPEPISDEVLKIQDEYLQERIAEMGITRASDLEPIDSSSEPLRRMFLWQGDITTLEVDAIVNAANNRMLGCFVPGHHCIDNAIHTFAGMQLRHECAELMEVQGVFEPTGRVKITGAYNLPSKYVFHTIGPIIQGSRVLPREELLLKSCYEECLKAATARNLESLAFCCISTGVFGYPQDSAAQVAIQTVKEYLANFDPNLRVIFNVFLDTDLNIYTTALRELAKA